MERVTFCEKAHYHLPGLFEFYEFYSIFLPLYRTHRDYFYDWCDIGSIYGSGRCDETHAGIWDFCEADL